MSKRRWKFYQTRCSAKLDSYARKSPAKMENIDAQVKKCFKARVIETSVCPWGFPVGVVYRNRRPRLTVNYRRLNGQTNPNEFPILRQSGIIQALSGSQVLFSFDALAVKWLGITLETSSNKSYPPATNPSTPNKPLGINYANATDTLTRKN